MARTLWRTPVPPLAWTSLSIGWFTHSALCNPDGSCWEFGGAPQFRATLEAPMGRGATIGVAATTSRIPLVFTGSLLGSCGRCDADANVSQAMATLHLGGSGRGFQQVMNAGAGVTFYSNFRSTDGARLTDKSTSSFNFAIGYGFGYGVTDRFQVMLVQDYGLVIHKRIPGDATNTANQSTTRIGARYGLGSKRTRGF